MSVNEKLITVDHLKHIRGYVNCATEHAIENLDEDLRGYINRQIQKVEDKISGDFDGDYSELENRLEELEKHFGNDDDSEEIAEVRSQLRGLSEEVSNKLAVLNSLRTQLAALQSSHDDLSDQVASGSVFNEEELKEIIDTALIEKTTITDDMVETPNVYTSNLVALIAKFGQIKADRILGNEIVGKTIKSLNNNWELNNDGSGKLANGKIEWNKTGDVTLRGVTIAWGDVTDKPNFDDVTGGITPAPSKFKSIVFKRGDNLSGASLTGGSWSNPRPTDSSWSDGIPTGNGKIWMSWKLFLSDDSTTADWSVPTLMVDTESFEVAYATIDAELENSISAGLPKDNKGNANPNGTFTGGWTDEPVEGANVDTYIYMATASCDNGVWGPWTVSKIKGEDGKDGTSIRVSGYYDTLEEFRVKHPDGQAPADLSECYVVAGNLWVWDPAGNQWRDVGQFKGDPGADGKPGDTYYLHIKYAKDIVDVDATGTVTNPANITLTADDGESTVGAKWIGVGHSKNSVDPSPIETENLEIYKWTKFVTDAEPVSYKSVVFARVNASTDLSNLVPTGGSYLDPIPAAADGVTWSDGIPSGEGIIWSTYCTFRSNVDYTTNTARWAKPTRMVDEADKFETAYGTADVLKADGSIDESGLPVLNGGANPNGTFTNGWYDEPELAPSNAEIVYMATANYSNGKWSPWHILQVKGEKGDKGGSVKLSVAFNNLSELIAYYNKSENGTDGVPHDENKDNAHIIKNSNHVDGDWENHLFVWVGTELDDNSTTDGDYFYKGWYDSGQFNGKDGKDGVSTFVSTVFMRSELEPATPQGGSFADPMPSNKNWKDAIPAGSEILWASSRTFSTDPNKTSAAWSAPAQMTDTSSFEVIYGTAEADRTKLPELPVTEGFTNANGWYDDVPSDKEAVWMATATCSNGKWSNWTVSKIKGEDGKDGKDGVDGLPGKDGYGLISTTIEYGISSSQSIEPTSWSDQVPTLSQGNYLWTKTTWEYNDAEHTKEVGYSKTYISKDGNDGNDGQPGKDGTKIVSTTITYAASTSGTVAPTTGWSPNPPVANKGEYVWTKMVWKYSDNTEETGYSVGKYGDDGTSNYVHVKYAKHIEFMPDDPDTIAAWLCELTKNGGEDPTDAKWMGVMVDENQDDLPLVQIGPDGTIYDLIDAENIMKYKWSKIVGEAADLDLDAAVRTAIGEFNITSNHIAAKTFDSSIDLQSEDDGTRLNYVPLPEGLPVELFETETKQVDGQDRIFDTGKSIVTKIGEKYAGTNSNLIYNATDGSGNIDRGPAWQIRKDGTGHFAAGKLNWDNSGNLSVKGKLLGTLGDINGESVTINGDLIIKKDDEDVLTLLSNHNYDNTLSDVDDPSNSIVFASGMQDKLYKWTLLSSDTMAALTEDETIDDLVPSVIYTKVAYEDNLTNTVVPEIYYKDTEDGKYFVLSNYQEATYSDLGADKQETKPAEVKKVWTNGTFYGENVVSNNSNLSNELLEMLIAQRDNGDGTIWYTHGATANSNSPVVWTEPKEAIYKQLGYYNTLDRFIAMPRTMALGDDYEINGDSLIGSGGHTILNPELPSLDDDDATGDSYVPNRIILRGTAYISVLCMQKNNTNDSVSDIVSILPEPITIQNSLFQKEWLPTNGSTNPRYLWTVDASKLEEYKANDYHIKYIAVVQSTNNWLIYPSWTLLEIGEKTVTDGSAYKTVNAFTYIDNLSDSPSGQPYTPGEGLPPFGGPIGAHWGRTGKTVPNGEIIVKPAEFEYTVKQSVIRIKKDSILHSYVSDGTITVDKSRKPDIANTTIESDGTIHTVELIARAGQFDGTINSDGTFSGELKSATGSINDGKLYNAEINDSVIYNSSINVGNSNSISCGTVFNVNPSLKLTGVSRKVVSKSINNGGPLSIKRSQRMYHNDVGIVAFNVMEGDSINIPSFTVSVQGYQPRKKIGKNGQVTNPKVYLHWKYVGDDNSTLLSELSYDVQTASDQLVKLTIDSNSIKYGDSSSGKYKQCTWKGTFNGAQITAAKNGIILVFADWSAYYTDKVGADKPSCRLLIDKFNTTITPIGDVKNNSTTISHDGIVIKAADGSCISTLDGFVSLISPDGTFRIKIADDGLYKKSGEADWTKAISK